MSMFGSVDTEFSEFVKDHFNKAECANFRPKPENENLCECGNEKSNHPEIVPTAARDAPSLSSPPSSTLPTDEQNINLSPTDAFGEINFGGRNNSKYIRVSHKTKAATLLELMKNHWKMDKPNLLLSVTGGAKNFNMNPRLKEVFQQGFIKVAQSTGAWIITGGMNAGVMKHVGEAVRDYTLKHGSKNVITTIGIVTWGCVLNNQKLISAQGERSRPVDYSSVASKTPGKCPLDPNHTHFILVDNSTSGKYGVEISLRTELEWAITNSTVFSDSDGEETVSIPIVCIVLEGGPNTIETVRNAIACGTPAIIVQGSGRAADILAHAYNNAVEVEIAAEDQLGRKQKKLVSIVEQWLEEELKEKIKNELEPKTDKKTTEILENIKTCVSNRDFMSVFKLDGKDSGSDIDITILKALLKCNKGKKIDKLKLALAWNRADVAKEQIFTDDVNFKPKDLYDLFYKALVQNKVEFVKLLISRGVSLKEFATKTLVKKLFEEELTRRRLPKQLSEKHEVSLEEVVQFVQTLTGRCCKLYKSPPKNKDANGSTENSNSENYSNRNSKIKKYDKSESSEIEDPSNVLFIWCVLVHRKDMSLVFWNISKEGMAMALMAQHLLKSIYENERDSEFALELQNQSEYFGELALGVLNECYAVDETKAIRLLVRQMHTFDNATVLKMAVEADNKEFVAHPACQNLLTNIWTDRLRDDNSYIRIILALLLPFCSPMLLKFRPKEINQKSKADARKKVLAIKSSTMEKYDSESRLVKKTVASQILIKRANENAENYLDSLEAFFKATFTTFCYNCVSFFAFLLLYGIILLTNFYPVYKSSSKRIINVSEMVLIAWVSTFLLEEIRQFIVTESPHLRQKLFNYFSDPWNVADIIAIITFYIGLILRFIPASQCETCFYAARIVLAFNLMMFFMRVLYMFSVHQQLGPKLVMIKHMMVDLYYFVLILLVFIISYGVTSHIILFPNQNLDIKLAKDVLGDAWWSVYLEMDIDLVSNAKCQNNPDTCPNNSTLGKCSAIDCAIQGYQTDQCYGKDYDCVANDWIVPILLALYALITNVMMLNLLIAMFSNTFEKVQGQSNLVWKMQRYHLVQEYESRPIWPPPLIVIGHLYQLFKWCCPRQNKKSKEMTKLAFRIKLDMGENKDLINWENIYAEEYLLNSTGESSMEFQVKETFKKTDEIMFKLDQLSENNVLSQTNFHGMIQLPPILEERFAFIEYQLKKNAQALSILINHLNIKEQMPGDIKDVDQARKEDSDKRQLEQSEKKKIELEKFKNELKMHKFSRRALYPVSDIPILRCAVPDDKVPWENELKMHKFSRRALPPVSDNSIPLLRCTVPDDKMPWERALPPVSDIPIPILRCAVPDDKVPWEIPFPSYAPCDYTSPIILKGNLDIENPTDITFNAFDQTRRYDRKSCTGQYKVDNGFPINPKGRTGMKGRGVLQRWGPNPVYKVVLTKWWGEEKATVPPTKYLKFLANNSSNSENTKSGNTKKIPEIPYPETNCTAFECLENLISSPELQLRSWLKGGGDNVTHLFEGRSEGREYYDDPRNTDNAWLEISVDNYHDELGDIENQNGEWIKIHKGMEVYAPDISILKIIADKHNASF